MIHHTPSTSLYEAFARQGDMYTVTAFDNIASYGWAILILIGAWIASSVVGWFIWYIGSIKWKRLCCPGSFRTSHKRDDDDGPILPLYNDPNESANKPRIVPVVGNRFSSGGPQLVPIRGEAVGTVPTTFKSQPVVQTTAHGPRWHGHEHSTRYESYLRLVVLCVRVSIVTVGLIAAFQAAGVNILSLAASLGVLSICFSLAASDMLSNILSAIYMYGTDKIEMRDYMSIGGVHGIVSALRAQWMELTDDLTPWMGRRIHQIPNRIPMSSIITRYPDGPPPEIIKEYLLRLPEVNKWREEVLNLPPLAAIDFRINV